MRILLGAIVPLFAIYLAWSIGSPPPKAVFWQTVSAEVTGYADERIETGYGQVQTTTPQVRTPAGETVRLIVEGVHDGDAIRETWPVGMKLDVRVKPSGDRAYAGGDPRLAVWYAAIITAGGLIILGFFLASFFVEGGSTQLFIGGIGACFLMLPLILLRFMWGFGDPPPLSLFWPSETVEVVSSEVKETKWAGGRTVKYPEIEVRFDDGTQARLETDKAAQPAVDKFAVASRHAVKRSPASVPYEQGLRLHFFIAFFMSFIGPVAFAAGCWLIYRALRPSTVSH